jgi:hypothetical protein
LQEKVWGNVETHLQLFQARKGTQVTPFAALGAYVPSACASFTPIVDLSQEYVPQLRYLAGAELGTRLSILLPNVLATK